MSSTVDLLDRIAKRSRDPRTRTDQTELSVPNIGEPLDLREIHDFENTWHVRVPELLSSIYTGIGNGGFGPGYGLLKFAHEPGYIAKDPPWNDETAVGLYECFYQKDPNDPKWKWPNGLLPISDWGCAIRSCVDCTTNEIIVFDPNLEDNGWANCFIQHGCSLETWWSRWCSGIDLWSEVYGSGEFAT